MNTFCQFLCRTSGQTEFDINKFSIGEIREGVQEFKNCTPLGKVVENSSAPPLHSQPKKKNKNILQSIFGFKDDEDEQENQDKINNDINNKKFVCEIILDIFFILYMYEYKYIQIMYYNIEVYCV